MNQKSNGSGLKGKKTKLRRARVSGFYRWGRAGACQTRDVEEACGGPQKGGGEDRGAKGLTFPAGVASLVVKVGELAGRSRGPN